MKKKIGIATCSNFFSFVTYIGDISSFYSKQLLVIYFCDCFSVYFFTYLEDLSP